MHNFVLICDNTNMPHTLGCVGHILFVCKFLLVPGAVHEVVAGDFYIDFLGLSGIDHLFELGG